MAFIMWCNYNGEIYKDDKPLLRIDNRSFKYGDGLFETMRMENGNIYLFDLHWERLILGTELLKITTHLEKKDILKQAIRLCELNRCTSLAKVRLKLFRDQPDTSCFLLEADPLPEAVALFNEEGLHVGLYPHSRKACDAFANMKTANFLPYVMASIEAAEKGVHDCLVLNSFNRICDSSRANIFLVKGGEFYTPALSEGCVAGVMRRYLIDILKAEQYVVHQAQITEDELLKADEIFLTNAVFGLRWIRRYKHAEYTNTLSKLIYAKLLRD